MRRSVSGSLLALAFTTGLVASHSTRTDDDASLRINVNTTTAAAVDPSLIVDLGYVRYQGVQRQAQDPSANVFDQVRSWYQIRYAASPEGPRRFAAPINIEDSNNYTSTQVIDASYYGPQCLNGFPAWADSSSGPPGGLPFVPGPNGTSEDCLLLNIHRPTTNTTGLPVIVQIHGGGKSSTGPARDPTDTIIGYTAGSAEIANGELFVARSQGSIIYIEIQYRLGGLGFISGSAIRANGTANAGYADQRSALNWIQRHIAAFGGDPQKVTILGGSAGAGSVAAQMMLYGGVTSPPFRAAIAEYPGILRHHEDSFLNSQYQILLQTAGCSDLACLRGLSFDSISAVINSSYKVAYSQGLYAYDDQYYQPSVDGTLIKELPSVAFKNGHFSKVPLISNHNALEGLSFTNASIRSDADIHSFVQKLFPTVNSTFLNQLDRLYPATDFGDAYFNTPIIKDIGFTSFPLGRYYLQFIIPGLRDNYASRNPYYFKAAQIFGDVTIVCPSQWLASGVANQSVPTWKLNYNSGVYVHGAVDVTLLDPINTAPVLFVTDPNETAALQAYVVGFAAELDPNGGPIGLKRQAWPQYGSVGNVLEINQTNVYAVATDPDINDRCQFWLAQNQVVRY